MAVYRTDISDPSELVFQMVSLYIVIYVDAYLLHIYLKTITNMMKSIMFAVSNYSIKSNYFNIQTFSNSHEMRRICFKIIALCRMGEWYTTHSSVCVYLICLV